MISYFVVYDCIAFGSIVITNEDGPIVFQVQRPTTRAYRNCQFPARSCRGLGLVQRAVAYEDFAKILRCKFLSTHPSGEQIVRLQSRL